MVSITFLLSICLGRGNWTNIPETLSTRFLSFRVKNPNREEIEKMLKNTDSPQGVFFGILENHKKIDSKYYQNYFWSIQKLLIKRYESLILVVVMVILIHSNQRIFTKSFLIKVTI